MPRKNFAVLVTCLLLALITPSGKAARESAEAQSPQPRQNIVLILPDNIGWGEIGVFGSVRGVPTPRLDRLASEGMRLTNFNVEFSCVVSRAALLTGRYAVRTGAAQDYGMTLWEITIAEALKPLGYATGLFGKWHLGGNNPEGKREPTHQGFDEFYGIPRTSNEAQTTTFPGFDPAKTPTPYIWEGKAGEPARNVKVFDLNSRPMVDREAAFSAFIVIVLFRAHESGCDPVWRCFPVFLRLLHPAFPKLGSV
jgi:arylsulfatase